MSGEMARATATALVKELEGLCNEVRELAGPLGNDLFWARPIEPGNSIGHLVLHLTGNLNHFVGAQLGGTGYVRDRQREFTETQVPPKAEALADLAGAVATFRRVAGGLTDAQLLAPHPEGRFGSVIETLVHLVAHFALHRGQMSYIVRLAQQRGGGC
jgi:uncharacterized damage-inducible protein DinB